MTPNFVHTIYNMHTTILYGWDFHTSLRFRLIGLEKQVSFYTCLDFGRWGVKVCSHLLDSSVRTKHFLSILKLVSFDFEVLNFEKVNRAHGQVVKNVATSLEVKKLYIMLKEYGGEKNWGEETVHYVERVRGRNCTLC